MKIFVTGSAGFIGSAVVTALIERGHSIAVLLRNSSDPWRLSNIIDQIEVIEGDFNHISSFAAGLGAWQPECVLHLGWQGAANTERNDIDQTANIQSSVKLAALAAEIGVSLFIGLGSQAEYGPQNEALDETAPLQPTTLYGAAKAATFHMCGAICGLHGVRFAWVRVFSTYGPQDNPIWLIPYLITAFKAGTAPALTPCEQIWDYLFVDDAAQGIIAVLETADARGPFNLGSGAAVQLRYIVTSVRDVVAPNVSLGFGEIDYRPDQVMHLEANISKLTNITGWVPTTGFVDGIKATAEWFLEYDNS